jgi:hypothetical protein
VAFTERTNGELRELPALHEVKPALLLAGIGLSSHGISSFPWPTAYHALQGAVAERILSTSENDSQTSSRQDTGNYLTGSDSATLSSTDNYSMTQTAGGSDSYTLTETGDLSSSGQENANTVTGAYSLGQSGSDSYTLTENGQNSGAAYTETVQGSESNSLSESGNTPNQTFSRTVSGSGGYSLTDSGPGATLANGSGSYSYGVQESGDWKSGSLSQTETGQDRYSLLQGFANVSNAARGVGPGNLNYDPFGLPFVDDAAEEVTWDKLIEAAKARGLPTRMLEE